MPSMSTAIDLDTIDQLTGGKLGTFDVSCPYCSSYRSTPANRRKKVFRIWRVEANFTTFNCIHCGAKGYVLDHDGPPPDPIKLANARAEAAERERAYKLQGHRGARSEVMLTVSEIAARARKMQQSLGRKARAGEEGTT
jgi:hypothetical protein